MSYARGLLTPALVILIGVGTGKQILSPPVPKNIQLTFVQASRSLTQRSSKRRNRGSMSSMSYPFYSQAMSPATGQLVPLGISSSKNSMLLRRKSRFVRRRRRSRLLVELLQYLRMRRDGLGSRRVNSVSLWIRFAGLRYHSTNTVLQRSRHDNAYTQLRTCIVSVEELDGLAGGMAGFTQPGEITGGVFARYKSSKQEFRLLMGQIGYL